MIEDDGAETARATATSARHGAVAPRGEEPTAGVGGGRFSRMFPSIPANHLSLRVLESLAACMSRANLGKSNGTIPAGYTYLGQFIDHDITFDPTSHIQRRNDPHALVNFRTPRLDLDSMYGGGPADQPFLYDWGGTDPGVRLLVDRNDDGRLAPMDLPRNRQGRALIGDGRNDENAIVSQLHLLFIRLHNKVVRGLRKAHPHMSCNALFEGAQRIVRWHYQWVVITDFLPKIVGKAMARSVLPTSAALPGEAAIPVEFSGAAYRFGHSMVRQEYRVQRCHPRGTPILGDPDDGREDLTGFRRLKASLAVEWDLFFFDTKTADELANLSMCIDPSLALPLFSLPPDGASLAELNLQRGRSLGLPAGADVAEALGVRCLSEAELTPQRLLPGIDTLEGIESLLEAPPLWYYILCESHSRGGAASAKGVNLGEVGGRIVAEVLVGLVERDPRSYIHQPEWTPHLNDGEWRSMVDLVKFVEAPADD